MNVLEKLKIIALVETVWSWLKNCMDNLKMNWCYFSNSDIEIREDSNQLTKRIHK